MTIYYTDFDNKVNLQSASVAAVPLSGVVLWVPQVVHVAPSP